MCVTVFGIVLFHLDYDLKMNALSMKHFSDSALTTWVSVLSFLLCSIKSSLLFSVLILFQLSLSQTLMFKHKTR